MRRLDTLSGWDVMDTSAREFDYKDLDADSLGGGGGAFDHYVGKMAEAGMDFSDFTIYSAAEVSVRIQRKASYFVLNYVMIVSMLTAVSWLTFFLDPMALDARAGVALTLLLAIGVFQLILNDALPKTGYLTPSKPCNSVCAKSRGLRLCCATVHVFILVSTFYVVMVVVESLLIYQLRRRQAAREAVIGAARSLGLKAAARRSLTAKAAGEGDDEERAASAASPSAAGAGDAGQEVGLGRRRVDAALQWLTAHLDKLSLVVFPLSYTIVTALLFLD